MLVSFDHDLIYLKAQKTAGTSVEMALQAACGITPGEVPVHTPALVNARGIVGRRGKVYDDHRLHRLWYNHLPATRLREQLDPEVWNRSLKVSNIRDPFDRMVSAYYFRRSRGSPPTTTDFGDVRADFAAFVISDEFESDVPVYFDGGALVPTVFIRFEALPEDLASLGARLGLPDLPERLPLTNRTIAMRQGRSVADHYTSAAIDHVRRADAWKFERFGYSLDPCGGADGTNGTVSPPM